MTEIEAIRELEWAKNRLMQCSHMDNNRMNGFNMAIMALEKQIPRKVKELNNRKDLYVASCTSCGYLVYRNQKYCDGCGQKLDWE